MINEKNYSSENLLTRSDSTFFQKLKKRIKEVNSYLCVGIDPHMYASVSTEDQSVTQTLETQKPLMLFCENLVEKTKNYVCCYKPNIAFFEAYGSEGIRVLEYLCKEIIPPEIPIILDAKRSDIDSTAEAYAYAYFNKLNVDAITVNPYLGRDGIIPFLKYKNKCTFVLCKTTNKNSCEIQNLEIKREDSNDFPKCLYMHVAELCDQLRRTKDNKNQEICEYGDLALVVGSDDGGLVLRDLRKRYEDIWFLIPGVGAQGASLHDALRFGLTADGEGVLVSISRAVSNSNDIEKAAMHYRNEINEIIKKVLDENGKI